MRSQKVNSCYTKYTAKGGCAPLPGEDFNKQSMASSETTVCPLHILLSLLKENVPGNEEQLRNMTCTCDRAESRPCPSACFMHSRASDMGQLALQGPGVCLPMKVLLVLLQRAGTQPPLQHQWPGSCVKHMG